MDIIEVTVVAMGAGVVLYVLADLTFSIRRRLGRLFSIASSDD